MITIDLDAFEEIEPGSVVGALPDDVSTDSDDEFADWDDLSDVSGDDDTDREDWDDDNSLDGFDGSDDFSEISDDGEV